MTNEVLEDIKNYAIQKLKEAYGFVGSAEADEMAALHSSDGSGNDIAINITIKPE